MNEPLSPADRASPAELGAWDEPVSRPSAGPGGGRPETRAADDRQAARAAGRRTACDFRCGSLEFGRWPSTSSPNRTSTGGIRRAWGACSTSGPSCAIIPARGPNGRLHDPGPPTTATWSPTRTVSFGATLLRADGGRILRRHLRAGRPRRRGSGFSRRSGRGPVGPRPVVLYENARFRPVPCLPALRPLAVAAPRRTRHPPRPPPLPPPAASSRA